MEQTKIGFFKRIKIAIINFEEYGNFIFEKTSKAFSYFFKLILIFSIIVTIALCVLLKSNLEKYTCFLKEKFPQFEISNNKLITEEEKEYRFYLEDLGLEIVLNNTNEINQSKYLNSIEFLKDGLIIKYMGQTDNISYEGMEFSKTSILEFFENHTWLEILGNAGIISIIIFFIAFSIRFLLDTVLLAILGVMINLVIKTKFKFKDLFKISIYSMTLPILLYLIYTVLNLLFGITIKYFDFAYETISYIYLITVMLIFKSELIKNTQELQKILKEEEKVKEEIKQEEQQEEQQEKDNKDEEKTKEVPQSEN